MIGEIAAKYIDEHSEMLGNLAGRIWENPELGYEEFKASTWIADVLEGNGFSVERGVCGIKTAIKASWGEGYPRIGLLGEYDALPGLSQKRQTTREPIVEGDAGHACGHNLLGVAHMGAAIAIKEEMRRNSMKGTIVFYGCPAEEGGNAKCFMARDGAFDDLDVNVHFHPGVCSTAGITGTARCATKFHFKGKTAHPSSNPQDGRSALAAVELMNAGANHLRAQVKKDVSIAYIITDGGKAPNIIPETATVWYSLRADKRDDVDGIYERIQKIAAGAAMMTETTVVEEFLGCTYEPRNNKVLLKVLEEGFLHFPLDEYTPDEIEYVKAINEANADFAKAGRERYNAAPGDIFHKGVMPLYYNRGSTDVGDVNHVCAGVSFRTMCFPFGAQPHTWTTTAMSNHSFAKKGMLRGAKMLAYFALKLCHDTSIVERAKAEFERETEGKPYRSLLPAASPKTIF